MPGGRHNGAPLGLQNMIRYLEGSDAAGSAGGPAIQVDTADVMKEETLIQNLLRVLGLALMWSSTPVQAGGNCLLHPQPFRLQSDTVHWSVKIISGGECIQGLRWSTIMIDDISIADQPKLGRLSLQGPSFRYFSNPGARGTDSFKLSVAGTSLRLRGVSSIEVDVTVQ
jgi:hypothetical protein